MNLATIETTDKATLLEKIENDNSLSYWFKDVYADLTNNHSRFIEGRIVLQNGNSIIHRKINFKVDSLYLVMDNKAGVSNIVLRCFIPTIKTIDLTDYKLMELTHLEASYVYNSHYERWNLEYITNSIKEKIKPSSLAQLTFIEYIQEEYNSDGLFKYYCKFFGVLSLIIFGALIF